jgi:hypothetical protein
MVVYIMDYQRLCERIFALHDDIRYAGIVDDTGLLIAGGMRNGIDSIVDQNNEELYLAQTALRKSMRQRFDGTMGRSRFAYVEREKISILTVYMNKNTVIVTMEPNVDSHTAVDIAQDALEILNDNIESSQ